MTEKAWTLRSNRLPRRETSLSSPNPNTANCSLRSKLDVKACECSGMLWKERNRLSLTIPLVRDRRTGNAMLHVETRFCRPIPQGMDVSDAKRAVTATAHGTSRLRVNLERLRIHLGLDPPAQGVAYFLDELLWQSYHHPVVRSLQLHLDATISQGH